jgi:hypothetical protein
MRDNVSADRADPDVNPLRAAAKHSMAVNLCAGAGRNRPENWAARSPNTRLVIDRR